ncbi:HDOD domain-containing protein [Metallumcola ferriviriculae]|uniref:HDOD domain-containing protein n=1 Tax=Metallumcola ferriviriculae TaxID=3039180 RepID=A0AAU0UJ87_9FIRM|nr:HDOD domain-containing protein [Desulfitibacteraceae bacterium MK1]
MDVFMARQPIFDKEQQVFAYELLFRANENNWFQLGSRNLDQATAGVITNSFYNIGINEVTEGKRAFINFTANLLENEVVTILPKELIGVEILESVLPSEDVIKVCNRLKALGYFLVLDDFVYKPGFEELLEIVDIVKIDFLSTSPEERRDIVPRLGKYNVKFLAEKIETVEAFNEAVDLGYTYFQGYFFCKPILISSKEISGVKAHYLKLLEEVSRADMEFDNVEAIVLRDVSLTYKMLRYINSAVFGFQRKIESIKEAMVILGQVEIKKWLAVVALSLIGSDKPDEVIKTSLIRARFGELLAAKTSLKDQSADVFLMGLFSLIDVLIGRPIEQVLNEVLLPDKVKDALLGEQNKFNTILGIIKNYELNSWDQIAPLADELQIDYKDIRNAYLDALKWIDFLEYE